MWTKRPSSPPPRFPGQRAAETGLIATFRATAAAADHCLVEPAIALADEQLLACGGQGVGEGGLVSRLAGLSATGQRAGGFSGGETLPGELPSLAGKPLPCVIHVLARAVTRHARPLHGSDELAEQLVQAGGFQLHAATVQEAADFALIAQRAAELALRPGLVFQDPDGVGASVQVARLPEEELIAAYLGQADEVIETPTAAQRLVFGERRRCVPVLMDLGRPGGLGGAQDRHAFGLCGAAGSPFFDEHVAGLLARAMAEFEALTGRRHEPLFTHRVDDAEAVLICLGAERDRLCALADLRRDRGRRVGVIGVTQRSPFPAAELARLLEGKRAAVVLERVAAHGEADGPLAARVRAALDRAVENGLGEPVHAGYPCLRDPGQRPRLLSGVYGVGGAVPTARDWLAVIDNLFEQPPRDRFHVGLQFVPDARRFPRLEVLEQQLLANYPDLPDRSLPVAADEAIGPDAGSCDAPVQVIRLIGASSRSGFAVGTAVARALGLHQAVRTRPRAGAAGVFGVSTLDLWIGEAAPDHWPEAAGLVLVGDESLLPAAAETRVATGARVLVASRLDAERVRRGIPARTWAWLGERRLRLEHLRVAPPGATADGNAPPWTDQQSDWMLLAAALSDSQDPTLAERCLATLHDQLDDRGLGRAALDEVSAWFEAGARADRTPLEPDGKGAPELSTAPWTAQSRRTHSGDTPPLSDPARFWHSIAYLYDRGQLGHAVPDPVAATGWMAAGSSARRNLGQHRFRTPEWLPENCTGCGRCWALCPDSALPATALTARELIEAGTAQLRSEGLAVTQLGRISGHLATQVDAMIARRGPDFPRTAGPLLALAFETLAERMGLDGPTREAMNDELGRLESLLQDWPIAVTPRWYAAEDGKPAPGRLLTIPFNPSACKGCGVCVAACPDRAFDWRAYTPEAEAIDRSVWQQRMALPDPARAEDSLDPDLAPFADLFSARGYHGMVGGDAAQPGSGVKTALHLVTAAVDAEAERRAGSYLDTVRELAQRLRSAIQAALDRSVEINDFEAFRQRLDGSLSRSGGLEALLAATRDAGGDAPARRVRELLDSLEELEALERRLADRPSRLFMILDEGSERLHGAIYPDNPFAHPWITAGSDPLALAEGLFDGLVDGVGREQAILRRAQRRLDGQGEHDPGRPSWPDLEPAERLRVPPVLVVAEAMEVAWGRVADLLAGDRPIRIVLIDRTGPGPGRRLQPDDLILALRARYPGATALETLADPARLMDTARGSLEVAGASVLQVYAPEPESCGFPSDRAFGICELAVRCGAIRPWRFGRDDAGDPATDPALTVADWALAQRRFRDHFTLMASGHLSDEMVPLADFIDCPTEERGLRRPYLDAPAGPGGGDDLHALPSPALVALAETRRDGVRAKPPAGDTLAPPPATAATGPAAATPSPIDPDFRSRLIEGLLELSGFAETEDTLGDLLGRPREPRDPT